MCKSPADIHNDDNPRGMAPAINPGGSAAVLSGSPSSSLDPLKHLDNAHPAGAALELDADPLALQSRWQYRLHAGRFGIRRTVIDAFRVSGDSKLENRAGRLASCGACPMLSVREDGTTHTHPGLCRDRLCPTCARSRSVTLANRTRELIAKADAVRLVTLTLRQNDEPLLDQLARLRECWKRLRRTLFWKNAVRGGVYGIEVKWNKKDGRWHPHLHALVTGSFLDQPTLSAVWEDITGDSFIVDVRFVHDRAKGADYVSKYVAKGSSVEDWPEDRICEFANAMHGQRLLQTFGELHGQAIDADDDTERDFSNAAGFDLVQLEACARRGDTHARWACVCIEALDADIGSVLCRELDLTHDRWILNDTEPAAFLRTITAVQSWAYPPPEPPEPTGEPMPRQDTMNHAARRRLDANRQQAFADELARWDTKMATR